MPPNRTAASRRLLAALALVFALVVMAIGTAAGGRRTLLPYVEIWLALAVGVIVLLELRPALVALYCDTPVGRRRALQRLHRQLDALPQTPHPIDSRRRASDQAIGVKSTDPTTTIDARAGTQSFPSHDRSKTDAVSLVLEMNVCYLEWLDAAAAAGNAYSRWCSSPPGDKAQAFAAYATALTAEEEAAKRYDQAVTELKRQAAA